MQEPNTLELWNKLHFEEEKRRVYMMYKKFSTYICWINIYKMQRLEVSGKVRPLYGSLGVKGLTHQWQDLLWKNVLDTNFLIFSAIYFWNFSHSM